MPLEARFSSLIRINDLRSESCPTAEPESHRSDQLGLDPKEAIVPLPNEIEEPFDEVEAFAKEWENNHKAELGKLDLEWTEEDEEAYREAENSLPDNPDLMKDGDLLGDELIEIKESNPGGEIGQASTPFPPDPTLGRPKSKSKKKDSKKDHKKKDPKPRAHFGPNDLTGAASKKIHHLHGRFSPKCNGVLPPPVNLNRSKMTTNPPARQVSNPQSKALCSEDIIGKGGSSSPLEPDK